MSFPLSVSLPFHRIIFKYVSQIVDSKEWAAVGNELNEWYVETRLGQMRVLH